jgi:hypothetical protein
MYEKMKITPVCPGRLRSAQRDGDEAREVKAVKETL